MLCCTVSYSRNLALSNSVSCCRGLGTNMSTTSRSCTEWGWVINLQFLTKWVQKGKTSFATAWKVTQRWGGQPASSSTILLSRFVSRLWLQRLEVGIKQPSLALPFAAVPQGFLSWGEADARWCCTESKEGLEILKRYTHCCLQTFG